MQNNWLLVRVMLGSTLVAYHISSFNESMGLFFCVDLGLLLSMFYRALHTSVEYLKLYGFSLSIF